MKISLTDAGKRFNREWIFRHFNYRIFIQADIMPLPDQMAQVKSTLLQVIAGAITPQRRKHQISVRKMYIIEPENQFSKLSFCAPYLELIEEMTAVEFLLFISI